MSIHTEKTIYEHPFLTRVLENIQPLLKSSATRLKQYHKKTGKIRIKQGESLSKNQYYDLSVFDSLSNILKGLNTLKHAQRFISDFPRPRTYEKIGISRNIWTEYHYSYYIVRFVSFVDLALILTNKVLRLGLREKDCKAEIIKNNEWIKNTNIKTALEKLEDVVKPFREPRNFHVHRGRVPPIYQIFDSELYDSLTVISLAKASKPDFLDKSDIEILDLAYEMEMKQVVSKLQDNHEKLVEAIIVLFSELFEKYVEYSKLLHQLGK